MPYDRGLKFAVALFAIAMFGALAQDQAQAQQATSRFNIPSLARSLIRITWSRVGRRFLPP